MKQITLSDLQRRERALPAAEAMKRWLDPAIPFSQDEEFWPGLLTLLRVQDGASLLELGGGKTSLLSSLGAGIHYEWVDTDPAMAVLQHRIYPEGRFTVSTPAQLADGEPANRFSVVLVHTAYRPVQLLPGACHEGPLDTTDTRVLLEVAVKTVVDGGYLIVAGAVSEDDRVFVSQRMGVKYHGPHEGQPLLLAHKEKPKAANGSAYGTMPFPTSLLPAPVCSEDPRPLTVKPWSISLVKPKPNNAARTEAFVSGKRIGIRFDRDLHAQQWAGHVLERHNEADWEEACRQYRAKLDLVNYLRLRDLGNLPDSILGLPLVQEATDLGKRLRRLAVRIARSQTPYPTNVDVARQYWSLGIGDKLVKDNVVHTVTQVEANLSAPPKVTAVVDEASS